MSSVFAIENLPNQEYHSKKEGWYSSSQLKDALEDIRYFYKKHVTQELEDSESTSALDIGSYFHTCVLEPEKVQNEIAIFSGYRRGREWDAFCEKHKGKLIITEAEAKKASHLISAVKESTLASSFLSGGKAEISLFCTVFVSHGEIFFPEKNLWLSPHGWVKENLIPNNGIELKLKVRADYLRDDFIVDLKSTTSNAKNENLAKKSVYTYLYALSAAMYLDLFYLLDEKEREFVWIFASKEYANCQAYLCSEELKERGRSLWKEAAVRIADHMERNWLFKEEELVVMYPFPNDKIEKGEELL